MRFEPEDRERISTFDLGALPPHDSRSYKEWVHNSFDKIAHACPHSQVVVLEGDKLLPWLASHRAFENVLVTTLVMRCPYRLTGGLAERLRDVGKLALMSVCRLRGRDLAILAAGEGDSEREATWLGCRVVPDPISITADPADVRAYREVTAIDPDRYWFGVFGHVSPRKNVDLVVRAIAETALAAQCGILIAGKFVEGERDRLARTLALVAESGLKVIVDDRLLADFELDAAILSVDAVIVAYSSPGPSGILAKALHAGRRVLVAGDGVGDVRRRPANPLIVRAELNVRSISDTAASLRHLESSPGPASGTHSSEEDFSARLLGRTV
jgi:glycosyltransferase involved in cell wall biosynthesis